MVAVQHKHDGGQQLVHPLQEEGGTSVQEGGGSSERDDLWSVFV